MGTFVVYLTPDNKWHYYSIDQLGLIPSEHIDGIARDVAKTEAEGVVDSPAVFACCVHASTPNQAKRLAKQHYKRCLLPQTDKLLTV